MQNVMQIATNAGHTAQNDGRTAQNDGRTTQNDSRTAQNDDKKFAFFCRGVVYTPPYLSRVNDHPLAQIIA